VVDRRDLQTGHDKTIQIISAQNGIDCIINVRREQHPLCVAVCMDLDLTDCVCYMF
jgi:hypothetical protein